MSTEVKVEFKIQRTAQSGLKSKAYVILERTTKDYICYPTRFLIREYRNSPTQFFVFDLLCCSESYIYQQFQGFYLENAICSHLARQISFSAVQMGFGVQDFDMNVSMKLTDERFLVLGHQEVDSQVNSGASEDVIKKLKRARGIKGWSLKENLEKENCSICLEKFSSEGRLIDMPCSHLFHESCVVEWLKRKNSCPLCRRGLMAFGFSRYNH